VRSLLLLTFVLLWRCDPRGKRDSELEIGLSELKLGNEKVISSIRKYIESTSDVPSITCMIVRREDLVTTTYTLSSIGSYGHIFRSKPLGYFFVDDHIILVYSGLERIIKPDDKFKEKLKRLIGNRIENDLLPDDVTPISDFKRAMVYDPPVHGFKLQYDSLIDLGNVEDPLAPPVKQIIKFAPPKVQ
jgi:hypothetical protein